jgi:hypothetical protein
MDTCPRLFFFVFPCSYTDCELTLMRNEIVVENYNIISQIKLIILADADRAI